MINEFSITQSPPSPLLSIQRGIKFQEAFILSGYSPASNHFSRIPSEKRGEGAVYANPPMSRCAQLCSGDGHKQRQCTPSPWSGGVKNFHPPSVLSLPYLSLSSSVSPFPLARYSTPRRFSEPPEEDRHVKKKVRILFPGMLLLQAPFLLSLLLLLLLSRITGVSKLQGEVRRGEEKEGGLDSLRRGRITRGQDGRRLVRILFPKCG